MRRYKITTVAGVFEFIGYYQPEFSTDTWQHYETNIGEIKYFRKNNIVAVEEYSI